MLSLDNRVIMISGANRGIGLAIAERLHADGAIVSLGARRPDALASATADLGDERVLRHAYDASVAGSDDAWLAATVERFGRLDGLVNCAGILESLTLESEDESALDRMFEVNVKGPYRLTKRALPEIRKSGTGRIVNLSSLSGVRIANDEVGYSMSKFAMTALSHATKRAGWDDGVRVTNVCPGYVDTDMPLMLDPDLDGSTTIQPGDLAELVSTVMRLPNTAAVSQLNVACRLESMI
jgi:NAD(P)-dependent dehydrogenase (short-subunit alcohol dehydrogenase family)